MPVPWAGPGRVSSGMVQSLQWTSSSPSQLVPGLFKVVKVRRGERRREIDSVPQGFSIGVRTRLPHSVHQPS